jgi:hypothetical protein
VNREMNRRVRSVAVTAFVTALCWSLGGCLSPTLPVPPPEPLALQEPLAILLGDAKSIQVQGHDAQKGAIVSLWNEEMQLGTIVKADQNGAYESVLAVDVSCMRPQNHIQLWQTDMEGRSSDIKTYRLPNVGGDVPLPPGNAGCPDAGGVDSGTD